MIRRLLAALLLAAAPAAGQPVEFSGAERERILQHGPWPPAFERDPSNRVSGRADAAEFGRRLFFDSRFSANGAVSCASCHRPDLGWGDGRPRSAGLREGDRNAPSLWNAARQRWMGWGGAADSLWAQAIRAMLDPREMGMTPAGAAKLVRDDPALACGYRAVFGRAPDGGEDDVLADLGKAMAAFVETLATGPTPFDAFRDALAAGRDDPAYPQAARRGLKIFVGRGNCSLCHFGPDFTHGEFHDVGVPFMIRRGAADPGRHGGIAILRADRFNRLGRLSDAREGPRADFTRLVDPQHRNFGEFKVPPLRQAADTGPYMHAGSHAGLADVVRHYSRIDEERLHQDGERILKPLNLSEIEIEDVVAFLRSLSDPTAPARARAIADPPFADRCE